MRGPRFRVRGRFKYKPQTQRRRLRYPHGATRVEVAQAGWLFPGPLPPATLSAPFQAQRDLLIILLCLGVFVLDGSCSQSSLSSHTPLLHPVVDAASFVLREY